MKYIQAFGRGFANPFGWRGGLAGNRELQAAQIVLICSTSLLHILHDALQTAFYMVSNASYLAKVERIKARHNQMDFSPIMRLLQKDGARMGAIKGAVWAKMKKPLEGSNIKFAYEPVDQAKYGNQISRYLIGQQENMELTFEQWLQGLQWVSEVDYDNDIETRQTYSGAEIAAIVEVFNAQRVEAENVLEPIPESPSLPEEPRASWLRFGIGATALTSIPQGAATYAAVFGFNLLCETYIGGLTGIITHGVLSAIIGLWLGSGRAWSGIASGLLVGASVFAIQVYGLPLLQELLQSCNICQLPELELHLVGGAATILATILLESIFLVITRIWETDTWRGFAGGDLYGTKIMYISEYPIHDWVDSKIIVPLEQSCGAAWTKPNPAHGLN